MPSIETAPGVRIFCREVGTGDPVVLVPGWSHSADVWDGQVRELAGAGRRVIAVDPRGQGRSDTPLDGYSIDDHAADLVALLDRLDIPRADLVGWSMGGVAAFRVAAGHADRVDKLALVGSNGVGVIATDQFPHGLPAEAVEQFIGGEVSARPSYRRQSIEGAMVKQDLPTVDWLYRDSMLTPSWAGIGSLRGLFAVSQVDDIPAVTAPVLMLQGEADPLFPLAGSQWVAERLKDARLVGIAEVGHFPHIEASDVVNSELLTFLLGATS